MKLFYVPGACSRAPHIVLNELGLQFQAERVDPKNKKVAEGDYVTQINPKGHVPALKLDNGEVLTETGIIIQYLADLKPAANLIPAQGTWPRWRVSEMIHHIATDLHKSFGPLFNPATAPEVREQTVAMMNKRLTHINQILTKQQTLLASGFSVADIYFYVVMGWAPRVGLDLSAFPAILGNLERTGQRSAVQATLKAEA